MTARPSCGVPAPRAGCPSPFPRLGTRTEGETERMAREVLPEPGPPLPPPSPPLGRGCEAPERAGGGERGGGSPHCGSTLCVLTHLLPSPLLGRGCEAPERAGGGRKRGAGPVDQPRASWPTFSAAEGATTGGEWRGIAEEKKAASIPAGGMGQNSGSFSAKKRGGV